MADVLPTKIIALDPVPETMDDSRLLWVPVTKLIANSGTTRKTYRMPYPHSGDAVSVDANGEVAVLVDNKTIKIVDNKLTAAEQVSTMPNGGLHMNEKYELSVIVDGETIDIDENGNLYCKSAIETGDGLDKSGNKYFVKLADKGGLKFVKHGIALNIGANGGLKLNDDGELEVRIASNCGLAINDEGEITFAYDDEFIGMKDGKIAIVNLGDVASLNIAKFDDEPSDETVWTSKTTNEKIDASFEKVIEESLIDAKSASAISNNDANIIADGKWHSLTFKADVPSEYISISGSTVTVPDTMRFVTVNMQVVITCDEYLENDAEIPIKVRVCPMGGNALVNTECEYIIDATENISIINYDMALSCNGWNTFAIQVMREDSGDIDENAIEMHAISRMTVSGIAPSNQIAPILYGRIKFDFKGLYNPIDEIMPNGIGYWEQETDTIWIWNAYFPLESMFEGKIIAKEPNEDAQFVGVDILEIECKDDCYTLDKAFYGCTGIENVLSITTTNLCSMVSTFAYCTNLKTVNINTENIISLKTTFDSCKSLTDFNILNTKNVTNMHGMFAGIPTIVTVPYMDTHNVTDMGAMFWGCTLLEEIPLFDTSNNNYMDDMFRDCVSLKTIPPLDTSNVTTMSSVFNNCPSLEMLPTLDTRNVQSMYAAFYKCKSLTSCVLSDTSNVTNIGYAFNASGIVELQDFYLPNLTNIGEAFSNMPNLVKCGNIVAPNYVGGGTRAIYRIFNKCPKLEEIGDIIIPNLNGCTYYHNNIFDTTPPSERIGNVDIRYTPSDYTFLQAGANLTDRYPKYMGDIYFGVRECNVDINPSKYITIEIGKLYAPNATNLTRLFAYHTELVEFGGAIDLHTDLNIQNASKLSTKSVHNIIDVATGVDDGYINVYLHSDAYENWINSEYYSDDIAMAEQKHIVIRNGVNVTMDITFEDESVSPMSTFIVNDTKWTRNEEVEENNWKCEILVTAQDCLKSKFQDVFKNIGNVVINEIDFEAINVMGVTDASKMFYGCNSITSVKSITKAEKLTNLNSMFYGCSSLRDISEINAVKVTDMGDMFRSCTVLNNVKLINTENVTKMNGLFYDCKALSNVDVGEPKSLTNVSSMFRNTALVEAPMFDTSSVTDMNNMFSGAALLETVPQYDTSSCTAMNNMFNGCKKMSSVPTFNTENCTNFESMFRECNVLEEIPAMNTSKGTKFAAMFYNCKLIKSVPMMDTSNGTTFNSMFEGCNAIESIPLINTSKGTAFNSMFKNCWALSEIPQIDTSNGTNLSSMCQYCKTITTAPSFNTSNATNMSSMFADNPLLESVGEYDVSNATNLSYMFNNDLVLTDVQHKFESSKCTNFQNMFGSCKALIEAPYIDTSSATKLAAMFSNCWVMESTQDEFDTTNCTDFNTMFGNCRVLKKAPIMDTSKGTNLSSMFTACYLLEEVPTLDVSSATAMNSMFNGCRVIKNIQMSGESSNCTNFDSTFRDCYLLEEVPTLNVSSATKMCHYIRECRVLKSVDFEGKSSKCLDFNNMCYNDALLEHFGDIDTSSATALNSMFEGCKALNMIPSLDTSKATNCNKMFNNCYELVEIPTLDISSCTNCENMFSNCRKIKTIELTNNDKVSVTNIKNMFNSCYELEELPLFDTSKVTNSEGFANTCKVLKSIPRYNVTAMTNTKNMFNACRYVESGIFDLYNDLSTKSITVSTYSSTFTNCGRDTWGGIAELNKIPTTWGGLGGPATVLNEYPYESHDNTKGIDTGVSLFNPNVETACMFFNLSSNTQYSLGINAARKENQSSSTEKIIAEAGYFRKFINGVMTNIISYTSGLKIAIKKENNSIYYTLDGIEWIDFGFDLSIKLYPCNNNSGNMYIAGIWDKSYNGTMGYKYWETVPDDLGSYFSENAG